MALHEILLRILHWLGVWTPVLARAGFEVFIIFIFVYAFLRIMEGTRGAGI